MQEIGIIGQGFVGSAVREGMQNYFKVFAFDKDPNKFSNATSIFNVVYLKVQYTECYLMQI